MVPDATLNPRFSAKMAAAGNAFYNPDIKVVRPRSGTFVYGTGKRFPDAYYGTMGGSSPGPLTYKIPSYFGKVSKRIGTSTFGLAHRVHVANQVTDTLGTTETLAAYNITLPRPRSAVMLGRFRENASSNGPGPGHYNVRRNPTEGTRNVKMVNDYMETKVEAPQSPGPGYYDVDRSLLKETFCKASGGVTSPHEYCNHTGVNCCKQCCINTTGKKGGTTSSSKLIRPKSAKF